MNSKLKYFPQYNKLNILEKMFLNTCCYFPPKPRRVAGKETNIDLIYNKNLLRSSYGKNIFKDFDGKNILDFGCGEGGLSIAIAHELPGSKVTGIDLLDGLEAANKFKKSKYLSNLNFMINHSSELKSNTYDFVFSHDSFEHFEDPTYILSEMIRLVKSDCYILIKFGPTWAGPYGRHMGGTFKKSRPWVHLFVPEKNVMRVHSVYHNRDILYENYKHLIGGLNKMTVKKAFIIFSSFENISIVKHKIKYVCRGSIFKNIPILNELFSSSLYVKLKKNN